MSKEWMVNAPNGSFVNIEGAGRLNHGSRVVNEKLAKKFPHIFVEVFSEAGPTLMEEPAPAVKVIDESPAEAPVLEEVPEDRHQEMVSDVPTQDEPVIEEVIEESPVVEKKTAKKKKTSKKKK